MKSILNDTKASIQFLSRLPIPYSETDTLPNFAKTAYTFPLAGLFIGLPAALVLWFASYVGLSPSITAIFAIAIMILATGALHEDGLADVADGFWGGHTKERKLDIMRDSSVGTYGVLTLIITVGLRVVLLAELIGGFGSNIAALVLVAVASLSRLGILLPWITLSPARLPGKTIDEKDQKGKDSTGLSQRYGQPELNTVFRAALCALPAIGIIFFGTSPLGMIIALLIMAILIPAASRLSEKHIGGHTGDTLGATQQLSELGLLLGLVWTM